MRTYKKLRPKEADLAGSAGLAGLIDLAALAGRSAPFSFRAQIRY